MNVLILTRRSLERRAREPSFPTAGSGGAPCDRAIRDETSGHVVLLEGDWDENQQSPEKASLDSCIDSRFDWIDALASEMAERCGHDPSFSGNQQSIEPSSPLVRSRRPLDFLRMTDNLALIGRQPTGVRSRACGADHTQDSTVIPFSMGPSESTWHSHCREPAAPRTSLPPPGYVFALSLRYYLVKLLRVVAYFSAVRPLRRGDRIRLIAQRSRDEDYADLIVQLADQARVPCRIDWRKAAAPARNQQPPNPMWRRGLGLVAATLRRIKPTETSGAPVFVCGNPRLLDPICAELVARGARVCWLYDRFAVGSWLRWQRSGVEQLVCNASLGRRNALHLGAPLELTSHGIDLGRAVHRWLQDRIRRDGAAQTRILEQLDRHFRRRLPAALVLDQDATPFARAAVAVGRRYGTRSLVVQHGAPACRFGFAPLAADEIGAWGRTSCQQLLAWGVQAQKIRLVGSPLQEIRARSTDGAILSRPFSPLHRASVGFARNPRRRILLLCTAPPNDSRPDSIALHLTTRGYECILRAAFAAVEGLPNAELIVKLHPRADRDRFATAARAAYPGVPCRFVRRGSVEHWLSKVDCVLSFMSSAGPELAALGVPVIQLSAPGAGEVLPHAQWGMAATVRSADELKQALDGLLSGNLASRTASAENVFSRRERSAVARIADCVLRQVDRPPELHDLSGMDLGAERQATVDLSAA